MSWFCSVCKKSFIRKDSIMRIDIVLKCHKILLFSSPKTTTTTTTTFLLFSFLLLLLLLLISTVFPPPRHFYCFSSSSSSFLLFFFLLLLLLLLHDILINPSNWIYLMRFHRKLMRYHSILFMRSRQ